MVGRGRLAGNNMGSNAEIVKPPPIEFIHIPHKILATIVFIMLSSIHREIYVAIPEHD
jgi:hypothetical protein